MLTKVTLMLPRRISWSYKAALKMETDQHWTGPTTNHDINETRSFTSDVSTFLPEWWRKHHEHVDTGGGNLKVWVLFRSLAHNVSLRTK